MLSVFIHSMYDELACRNYCLFFCCAIIIYQGRIIFLVCVRSGRITLLYVHSLERLFNKRVFMSESDFCNKYRLYAALYQITI